MSSRYSTSGVVTVCTIECHHSIHDRTPSRYSRSNVTAETQMRSNLAASEAGPAGVQCLWPTLAPAVGAHARPDDDGQLAGVGMQNRRQVTCDADK
eukprot:225729-Rhodomonas_salina.1